jgi:tetratricopeptide (TPR) repeat protein
MLSQMGFLDSFKTRSEREITLDEVVARARAGDTQGALIGANEKLAASKTRHGEKSPAYATALFEHSSICLLLGLRSRAVEVLRESAEIRSSKSDDEKNRLTYLMSLGDIIGYAGDLDEALVVHTRGLAERENFYGQNHPGYAYGLDAWADVAIALGRFDDALPKAQEALAIYDAHNHSRVPRAWALIFLAGAGANCGWKSLEIEPEAADEILGEITNRLLPVSAKAEFGAVETLAPLVGDQDRLLRAFVHVESLARKSNDSTTRVAALERIRDLAEEKEDDALALDADLGIALTFDHAGDHDHAAPRYEWAVDHARSIGTPEALSKGLRNAGLYFVAHDEGRGLALLREAVAITDAPKEELARSQLSLGMQLQHRAHLDEARTLLVTALTAIEQTHPDAICARSHLKAIDEKRSCGCGDVTSEIHAQVLRIVQGRLPVGLLDRLEFSADGVGIHVTRELSEDETRLVADTVDLAMTEMRKRISPATSS